MEDDAPSCSACGEPMASEAAPSDAHVRVWRCRCGAERHERRHPSAGPKPDRNLGRCWLSWDDKTERYTGYLAQLDERGRGVRFAEAVPKLRSLIAILAWATENAASVFVRPHWDPDTTYHTGASESRVHPSLDLDRALDPPYRSTMPTPTAITGVLGNCANCDWTGNFTTVEELRAAYTEHVSATHDGGAGSV